MPGAVEGRRGVVEYRVGMRIPFAVVAHFTTRESGATFVSWLCVRKFDGAHDGFACARRKRNEFTSWTLQDKTVFVFATLRIRTERGNRDAVFAFDGLRVPFLRRAVSFRRQPAFDVPAVEGKILWDFAQFDDFTRDVAVRVGVRPFAADPREARPAPDDAEIRFAVTVQSASAREAQLQRCGRDVRFAKNVDAMR